GCLPVRPLGSREPQRLSKRPHAIAAGRAIDPALEVADGPFTEPGPFRERFLGEARRPPPAPPQRAERRRRFRLPHAPPPISRAGRSRVARVERNALYQPPAGCPSGWRS